MPCAGFVMFTMICVNDLANGGARVPDWMVHFSERHQGGSGMTFVDVVFPAFLLIVGMSIPFALGSRLNKGEPIPLCWCTLPGRTCALLAIGILMVNAEVGAPQWWTYAMFFSSILAFCTVSPRASAPEQARAADQIVSAATCAPSGFRGHAAVCNHVQEGPTGQRIITWSPLHLRTEFGTA